MPSHIIDPPRIDRERALADDRARQQAQAALQQILRALAPGERLGRPVRRGAQVVVPIEGDSADEARPAPSDS